MKTRMCEITVAAAASQYSRSMHTTKTRLCVWPCTTWSIPSPSACQHAKHTKKYKVERPGENAGQEKGEND